MKVGVLGSGVVGQTLAAGFLKHGHQVMLGTRDTQGKDIQEWAAKTSGARVGRFSEAAGFGEILVLAVGGRVVESVIRMAEPQNLSGKVLIDVTNPLADGPPVKGVLQFTTGPNESLGEKVQALAPQAHVVKAFNSVGTARMVNPQFEQGPPTMFLCGDHEDAKSKVSEIIRQFGWEPFDCGGIIAARALEPLCMLWCIPGFLRNQWTHAFKVLTR
ncbi:MAG: NAD(P)-binding domain-containing protein [Acidobacteriia bacterium]|nr:NAD(P)-binding domain-containing protein [Terriglobia bacterium]